MSSVDIDFLYGLVGTFLFIFRNPDKRCIYPISIFIIGLFASQLAYFYFGTLSGQVIWAVSAIGLLICYAIRVSTKKQKGIIEFFKGVGVILLTIYPLPFYSMVHVGDGNFWTAIRTLTFLILVIIYLYDRWILKPEEMKRKYIIVLVGQSILILLMSVYAVVQKAEADKARELADLQRINALENEIRAEEMKAKYDALVRERAP